jgi:hypothetical protein
MGIQKLKDTYAESLRHCRETMPNEYAWPIELLPTVTERMLAAIDKRSFNKDSAAWKLTCKTLGIPHTYKAIFAFADGSDQ